MKPLLRIAFSLLVGATVLLTFSGCETLPLSQRQYIAQPCMLFDGTGAHKFDAGLTRQIETGRAGSGGAAGGGCSSCH